MLLHKAERQYRSISYSDFQGYGLTETAPVLTANRLDGFKYGEVGKPFPDVDIKIAEDGEILAKGPNVKKEYYNNPEAAAEVIDKEEWFHNGDVRMFDLQLHLMTTDRKKHPFVKEEYCPPPQRSKASSCRASTSIRSFSSLVGDGRMFLAALVVPEFEGLRQCAVRHGISFSMNPDLVRASEVMKLCEKEIQHLQRDLPTCERVREFELQLTVQSGEITSTLKVKSKVAETKYAD